MKKKPNPQTVFRVDNKLKDRIKHAAITYKYGSMSKFIKAAIIAFIECLERKHK